ncbi:MAG: AAA family ATPase [Planctomycetes bacterium]|nr:AAA family ATPase [Planctomycetota bacterium]
MLSCIQFRNYKALRDCRLPLDRITVLIGPNGAGKSTVLEALQRVSERVRSLISRGGRPYSDHESVDAFINVEAKRRDEWSVEIRCGFADPASGALVLRWSAMPNRREKQPLLFSIGMDGAGAADEQLGIVPQPVMDFLRDVRVFTLDPKAIARPAQVEATVQIAPSGANLAAVLDGLRDEWPERFEALNEALPEWFPEFDRLLFDRPAAGKKSLLLRTRAGGYRLPACALSDGTLIGLCLLTLAYLPNPPRILGLEEPGRGLHPRLLAKVHDALVRLAYPEQYGETRAPVQVVATTHSPYFIDLFKDHPEHVIIASKKGFDVRFESLADNSALRELISASALGDVWYSGVLGGVPVQP